MATRTAAIVPLRRRLLWLALAALVPLAVIAGIGLAALIGRQHEEARRNGIELTRALATAVEAELGRSISVMQAIVSASALDHGDVATFHRRMIRVVGAQPNWRAIALFAPDGSALAHSGFSWGAPLPPLPDPGVVARVRDERAPVIGLLAPAGAGELEGSALDFSIGVPVVRDRELRYIAIARVDPNAIHDILRRQRVPPDWVISIFDAAGQRVARSRLHDENLGKPGAPSVVALMASPEDEGWGLTTAIEGDRIYTAYSRVKGGSGWTIATGIPVREVDAAVWRTAQTFGGGLLLSIAIGIVAASLVARSITGPIASLRSAAEALGRREPVAAPATAIVEIQRVGEALAGAAEERARGELERELLLQREQHARAAAEAASRAKDEFLAMLGHELRNPLGALSNAVAMLDHAGASSGDVEHARAIAARQTAHLARLTDDLLDVGRVITGKIALNRQPLDLAELVVRALASVDVGRRRVVRSLESVWVDGDPTRLEQIVVNLVGNAVKFTGDDGAIAIEVGLEAGGAVIRVSDDGAGMPPELIARVFELFVQGERSLDRAAGGLGIGLTLVQRLAELHGGSAEAASPGVGKGSQLTVRLPAIPDAAERPVPDPTAAAEGRARDVLVIEDNDDARTSLCKLLELSGHRVRSASDGPAGLLLAVAEPPEIVLVDVGLPGIDGYEVARRLRAVAPQRITLVAITGYGLPGDRERALAAGFDVHLVKPVNFAVLAQLLS